MRFGGGTPILYGAAATVGLQVVRVAVKAKREYQPRVPLAARSHALLTGLYPNMSSLMCWAAYTIEYDGHIAVRQSAERFENASAIDNGRTPLST